MLKKLLIGFGILFGLLVIAAIVVPLFVDVDKYRPEIERVVDQKLNGKLELGKLSLSLWGQVRVQVDGMKLTDRRGDVAISVQDVYFKMPFSSILSGSPELVLDMNQPAVHLVRERNGKINALSLLKTEKEAPPAAQAPAKPSAPRGGAVTLPPLAARARLGLDIHDATVTYKDELSGMSTEIKDLNFIARDISLSHKMTFELFADLDTQSNGTRIKGPARLTATADPKVEGGKFRSVDVALNGSLDDLEVLVPGVFEKAKGVAANLAADLSASPESATIDRIAIRFFNAEIDGKGSVTNLAAGEATPPSSPVVHFELQSNRIELKPWVELLPALKQYELGGTAGLTASANGPADKLGYEAELQVSELTARAPDLKAQPRIDALVHVKTDAIDRISLTMKAPGNDLSVQGKVVGFHAPHVDLAVTSTGLDLDQLIAFPARPAETAKTEQPARGTPAAAQADSDAKLAPLRESKALQSLVGAITVNLRQVKARGVEASDVSAKMSMRDLAASLDSFSVRAFGGSMKASGSANLRPRTPTYRFGASAAGIDLQQAVASQFAFLKNTVTGKASFDLSGDGASFNPMPAVANLKASGKLKVDNAAFSTLDVSKMATQALMGAVSQVSGKIPGLKGKSVGGINKASRYDVISSSFKIADGRFTAPDFVAKAAPNQGIDLKGNVVVGMKDQSLNAHFLVIDTYNLTHARDISVNVGGTQVSHILADGSKPVQFPVTVGCTLTAPCYSYTEVPEALLKVAMKNTLGGAKSAAVRNLIKQAPPQLQNQLKGLSKRLFGN